VISLSATIFYESFSLVAFVVAVKFYLQLIKRLWEQFWRVEVAK